MACLAQTRRKKQVANIKFWHNTWSKFYHSWFIFWSADVVSDWNKYPLRNSGRTPQDKLCQIFAPTFITRLHFAIAKVYEMQITHPCSQLTGYGLVRPYGDINLCQHWLTYWFVAWRYHAITWTNVDVSSKVFCGIHLREISHEIPMEPIRNMNRNSFAYPKTPLYVCMQ